MSDQPLLDNLAANLKFHREKQGWSKLALARLCKVNYRTILRIEQARVSADLVIINRLRVALNLKWDQLLGPSKGKRK